MLDTIYIHSTTKVDEPKFIKPPQLVTFTRGDKLGTKQSWEVQDDPHDSVHILVNKTDTQEILLVQQYRIPTMINSEVTKPVTECCAGLVDSDLLPIQIAYAEVQEELGYKVRPNTMQPIGSMLSSVGTVGSMTFQLYCEVTEEDFTGQDLGPGEDIEVYSIPYADIKDFLEHTIHTDPVTKYLLQWFLLNKGM